MREILFRGKRKENGEWIKGDFCSPCNIVFLENRYDAVLGKDDCPMCNDFEVIPETVGQYTGLTDKNGKKIFEGDIVEIEHSIHHYREDEFPETYRPRRAHSWHWDDEQKAFLYKRNYVVEWKQKDARWILRNGSDQHDLRETILYFHNAIIIGNIHDNPELLKGDAKS